MKHSLSKNIEKNLHKRSLFRAELLNLHHPADLARFTGLLHQEGTEVFDTIGLQLRELHKLRNPSSKFAEDELQQLVDEHLNGEPEEQYGIWAYYPWNGTLVHLLPEDEFTEVRTNRNRNKITAEEQAALSTRIIGVIGMSVGSSIAVTMAMERICGELRIADFDTLDLSNMNRIRTGVDCIGLPKVILVAREIAMLDPYLKVLPYPDGVTAANMEDFMVGAHKLDMLVDVCDDMVMKVLSRLNARRYGIPVVMETSDRGMLDIEQFQFDPERPLFHGMLPKEYTAEELSGLSPAERFALTMQIVQFEKLSARARNSIAEIGKTLGTWPQLASSIMLGAGTCTEICRQVLLGQFRKSGRYYVDLNEILQ
jgi:hypothetical protein